MALVMNPYSKYVQNKVNVTSKGSLLIMVYDSAIRNLKEAKKHIDEKNLQKKGEAINIAYKAVSELLVSLDFNIGGDIPKNLSKIYNYILREITSSNIANDSQKLNVPLKILEDLRVTWLEVIKIENNKSSGSNAYQKA
ncbi:MAG: flagellar export chaperone FliS [Candidatus Delongbacteria bacterium]|nr:flagellar export chaperone FliS [Candidatus Delongbacteria bacterium]MBN2836043.1 flagellar export chaperone FliS [Candidatus Delongbacteria bacterium]